MVSHDMVTPPQPRRCHIQHQLAMEVGNGGFRGWSGWCMDHQKKGDRPTIKKIATIEKKSSDPIPPTCPTCACIDHSECRGVARLYLSHLALAPSVAMLSHLI